MVVEAGVEVKRLQSVGFEALLDDIGKGGLQWFASEIRVTTLPLPSSHPPILPRPLTPPTTSSSPPPLFPMLVVEGVWWCAE